MDTYYVYIFTNKTKAIYNIGLSSDLNETFERFNIDQSGEIASFEYRVKSHYLIYYKAFTDYDVAKNFVAYLKSSSRLKQEKEIKTMNAAFLFLTVPELSHSCE